MARAILVVDDSPDDQEITRCVLEQIDPSLEFVTAESGEAALALLAARPEPPALMLLDMKMPGMSGIEVLGQMQADERLRRIPVLLVSHSTLDADRDRAAEAGTQGFLHKSFELEVFTRELRAAIERWATR